jgi:hypothetical protein
MRPLARPNPPYGDRVGSWALLLLLAFLLTLGFAPRPAMARFTH